jgi:SAM-dependent methyltransferase
VFEVQSQTAEWEAERNLLAVVEMMDHLNNTTPMNLAKRLKYVVWSSQRRKLLDRYLIQYQRFFAGKVLDIGGGRRKGLFRPPKGVEGWITADIDPGLKPDMVCNVEQLPFPDQSFDVVKATELFEHVNHPEEGIRECFRILKQGGYFIISAPFLFPVHGDPHDYQRWTERKWREVLASSGFFVEKIEYMGRFFTVLFDMLKALNKRLPGVVRHIGILFYPILYLASRADNHWFVMNSNLKNYTTGFFIVSRKLNN